AQAPPAAARIRRAALQSRLRPGRTAHGAAACPAHRRATVLAACAGRQRRSHHPLLASPSARAARRTRKAAFTSPASTARGTASEKVHSPSLLYSPSGLAG